jgi:ankyrin repeat protein
MRLQQCRARRALVRTILALLIVGSVAQWTHAHETDQYTLPPERRFADLSDHFTKMFYDAVASGVEWQNTRIKAAVASGIKPEIEKTQSPDQLVIAVNRQFSNALFLINSLDDLVTSNGIKERYPGRVVGYKPTLGVRKNVDLIINPFRTWQCATVFAFGTYTGNDKVGHFTDMGKHYYDAYRAALAEGKTEEQANRAAINVGCYGFIFSERGLLGLVTAGDYSNADLVSNYMGFCFYKNLTQPVMLKGVKRPPMVVRDGDYWKLADFVRPDSDFFSWFIPEHFNEALNPGMYRGDLRNGIRKAIVDSRKLVLQRYTDPNGDPRPRQWFIDQTNVLKTYYGVDYGHQGDEKKGTLLTIADTCFAKPPRRHNANDRNADGLTSVHYAAAISDLRALGEFLDAGANPNVRVISDVDFPAVNGDTPLHIAARNGHLDAVKMLIAHHADVNAANARGDTPLHMSVEHPEIAKVLIAAGAKVNVADAIGRTPLHWASKDTSAAGSVPILLAAGANPMMRDRDGQIPLHDAASSANESAIVALVKAGANPDAADRFKVTPLHLAAANSGARITDLLIRLGAHANAKDAFGCTPLHVAVRHDQPQTVEALLARGADPSATDAYGQTALAIANREHLPTIAQVLQQPTRALASSQ